MFTQPPQCDTPFQKISVFIYIGFGYLTTINPYSAIGLPNPQSPILNAWQLVCCSSFYLFPSFICRS